MSERASTGKHSDAASILMGSGVQVHPGEFAVIGVDREAWTKLLQDSTLSPSGDKPFMIFSEVSEVTLVVDASDLERLSLAVTDLRAERGFRLITFTTEMDFSVTGFMAEVSGILARAGVSILALSSFSRDHLLVRQTDLATALKALGPHVGEVC